MSFFEHSVAQGRRKIGQIASQMLAGDLTYIEGARAISSLLSDAQVEQLEAPFVIFIAIDSETDGVPLSPVRELWQPAARERLEPEWAEAESYAKTIGEKACWQAIKWVRANPGT